MYWSDALFKVSAIFAALAVLGCTPDETLTAYAQGKTTFTLKSINGAMITEHSTIDISVAGRVSGKAACNTYHAAQTAPYPWFAIGPIAANKMACPALEIEALFLETIANMSLAEISGDTLILSDSNGQEMIFQAP